MILQTLNADVTFLPETSWSEMCLFWFPVSGEVDAEAAACLYAPRDHLWKKTLETLGSLACCFCELDSVFSAFLSPLPPSEWQTEQRALKTSYRGRYETAVFRDPSRFFHLVPVFVTRDCARRPRPRRNSVAERWPPTLFCSFLHCCPAKAWSECAVYRDQSGARRVSLSSNCFVCFIFSCFFFFAIWFFFSRNFLCFFWWVFASLRCSRLKKERKREK